jgi:hypothetical protein
MEGFTLSMSTNTEEGREQSLRILARLIARRIEKERLAKERKASQNTTVGGEVAGRPA